MNPAAALAIALHAAVPDIPESVALVHAEHAIAVANDNVPAELVLATAVIESNLDSHAVSNPHHGWPRFCGPLQTIAHNATECRAQADLDIGYGLGVAELDWWVRHEHGNVRRALIGHGCGAIGLRLGWCGRPVRGRRYPERVLNLVEKLRKAPVS